MLNKAYVPESLAEVMHQILVNAGGFNIEKQIHSTVISMYIYVLDADMVEGRRKVNVPFLICMK